MLINFMGEISQFPKFRVADCFCLLLFLSGEKRENGDKIIVVSKSFCNP